MTEAEIWRRAARLLEDRAAGLPFGAKAWPGYRLAADDLNAVADELDTIPRIPPPPEAA